MKARIDVYPRREILDPQGKAIRQALQRSGLPGVESVRAGKSFEVDLGSVDADTAKKTLESMCEKLLANTVVEEYRFELLKETKEARP
jgi:phosphoribosylformylglycinamidine synthase